MSVLPAKFAATAPWWKVYLAALPVSVAATTVGAARRFDGDVWLWTLPAGPALAALITLVLIRTRRGDRSAGLDPAVAAAARADAAAGRMPEDPAVRDAARRLLPGLIEQQRRVDRRWLLPGCALGALVLAGIAPIRGEWEWLVPAAMVVVLYGLMRLAVGWQIRRLKRLRRKLD